MAILFILVFLVALILTFSDGPIGFYAGGIFLLALMILIALGLTVLLQTSKAQSALWLFPCFV